MKAIKIIKKSRYFNMIPLIITLIPILMGIISGLRVRPNDEISSGILDILNRMGIFEKPELRNLWIKIIIHNLSLSLLVGILGLISGGLFTILYLFSWWSLWIETIKINSVAKCFFVIPESIGITFVVLFSMYIGLNYLVYRKYSKYQIASFKQIFLLVIFIFISIAVTVLGQSKSFTGNSKVFFESGFIMLSIVYFFKFVYLYPMLVIIRLIRVKQKLNNLLVSSVAIILLAFVPLTLIWAIMSLFNLIVLNIPWSIFSNTYIWMNAILLPITLFYSYWKYTDSNIIDSLLDSMILSGLALIIPLIHI